MYLKYKQKNKNGNGSKIKRIRKNIKEMKKMFEEVEKICKKFGNKMRIGKSNIDKKTDKIINI